VHLERADGYEGRVGREALVVRVEDGGEFCEFGFVAGRDAESAISGECC